MERSHIRFRAFRGFLVLFCILFLSTGYVRSSDSVADLITRGEENLLKGHLTLAAGDLERALNLQPENPRILSDLARVYFHLQRYGEAEKWLRKALSLNPQEGWVRCWSYNYLGKIYMAEKAFPLASHYFLEAASLDETANCIKDAHEYLAYLRLIHYAQERLTHQAKAECCKFHYGSGSHSEKEIASITQEVQGYYEKILRLLDLQPSPSGIPVYLYPPSFKYDLWEAKEILARNAEGEIHVHYDGREETGPVEHEMVHVMTAGLKEKGRLIPLLMEGLAEYVVGNPWGLSLDKWVRGFLDGGEFISVAEIADPQRFRRANPIVSYSEAGSFVKFLIEEYGLNLLFRFIKENGSWEEFFQRPLQELERAWLRKITSLEITAEEIDLVRYRVWLGNFFNNQRLYKKRLPWVGMTYYVSGEKVIIDRVAPFSPGLKAGLRPGDWIKRIDQVTITGRSPWKLASIVHRKEIGDEVSLTIEREGREETLKILLERETGYELQGEQQE